MEHQVGPVREENEEVGAIFYPSSTHVHSRTHAHRLTYVHIMVCVSGVLQVGAGLPCEEGEVTS